MSAMHGLPGLVTYLAEWPELTRIDVGLDVVINGRPVPTKIMAD